MSYNKFSKREFERIFYAVEPDFLLCRDIMNIENYAEYIYSADVSNGFSIIIYSTVSTHTDKARAKGNDAIRVNLLHEDSPEVVRRASKTLRTDRWMVNLQKKINSLIKIANEATQCDECGSYLATKKGTHGAFFGCVRYPDCDNTESIDE